ncbi:alpha/beta fold hydrolase [Candidatus Poribacteria bacterium]|nr:alpha/beta fold hydrolase [Candidatus Poribacteria bacterium]
MARAMHRPARICVTLAVLAIAAAAFAQESEFPEPYTDGEFALAADFMSYDASIPLDAAIVGETEFDTQTRYKVAFRGSRDEIIPGFLSIPKEGDAPFPCVLLMHGLGDRKQGWWDSAFTSGPEMTGKLIALGYAVFALDAKYHGERSALNRYEEPWAMFGRNEFSRLRALMTESTDDYRRGLDWLETRDDIDADRIGAIGYSMGGMMLYYLAALDSRVDVAVACVAPPMGSPSSSPARVAPHVGDTPFAMLMGAEDQFYTEAQAQHVLGLIPGPDKMLKFYESGYSLPVEYVDDATAWIDTHLK